MNKIGEIHLAPAIRSDVTYSEREYFAPTIYSLGNISNWNYYSSLEGAGNKWWYIFTGSGSATAPAGNIPLQRNNVAQTMGINVDFFTWFPVIGWTMIPYKAIRDFPKDNSYPLVYRFYTIEGAGPYYGILDWRYIGASATLVKDADPDKVYALDQFYREVQLLKFRYNYMVGFLNDLSQRQLNPIEQQIFNEGILLVNNMSNQMQGINGIEITYSQDGKIALPFLLIIAIIAIIAAATAWSITTILTEKEKTKRINDSYDLNKWVTQKKIEVAQKVNSGEISQSSANSIYGTLDAAAKKANEVAENASKDTESIIQQLTNLLKWGVIGFLLYKGFQYLQEHKKSKTQAA